MSKKELKKEIREMLEFCDVGKIIDFNIYDSTLEKGKIVYCDVITIKNHIVTKYYYTYDVDKNHIELPDVKNLY